ncbi:winged helix-turn-helix transcriptional regulator [Nocardia higoensis]|uniref:winged helix-turn-helix transcriptional regulator n=1 Tax=Nocardia higoensis TaxID=228599 RepID=UPI0002E9C483|nr:helix-turn-helix domain-containing protein [Nocardia higoensis]
MTQQLSDPAGRADEAARPDGADLSRADSPAREIFADIANKWTLLIVETIGEQTLRFTELRDRVEGISPKMLTQNLRMMERNGLVERTVHSVVPPRVDYRLTESGLALRGIAESMCAWTRRFLTDIEAARRRFDE